MGQDLPCNLLVFFGAAVLGQPGLDECAFFDGEESVLV